jgi:hypothetical protein
MSAMRCPMARDCDQPPYVSGGSYGVGDDRCHSLSAASRRFPCLRGGCERVATYAEGGVKDGIAAAAAHEPDDENVCWGTPHGKRARRGRADSQ